MGQSRNSRIQGETEQVHWQVIMLQPQCCSAACKFFIIGAFPNFLKTSARQEDSKMSKLSSYHSIDFEKILFLRNMGPSEISCFSFIQFAAEFRFPTLNFFKPCSFQGYCLCKSTCRLSKFILILSCDFGSWKSVRGLHFPNDFLLYFAWNLRHFSCFLDATVVPVSLYFFIVEWT